MVGIGGGSKQASAEVAATGVGAAAAAAATEETAVFSLARFGEAEGVCGETAAAASG